MAKWASSRKKGLVARLRGEEMFLNHGFVPWSIVRFNEWLKINHKLSYINSAGVQMTFSFEPSEKLHSSWKFWWLFFFTYYMPPISAAQSLQKFQLNCPILSSSLSFPNLSLGLWRCVILFFPRCHFQFNRSVFCSPVLWIKMGFFMDVGACCHGWAPLHSNALYLEGE